MRVSLAPILRAVLLTSAVSLLIGAIANPPSSLAQNQVLKLDGKDSYVELPPNIFKDLTQATIEAWVKFEKFSSYARVFEFGAPWQSIAVFIQHTNADLRFNVYPRNTKIDPSAQHVARATNVLRLNEWTHIAAVCGGKAGMKLYVNGVLVASNAATSSCFSKIDTEQMNLVGRGMSGNPTDRDFKGEIDELRVWNVRRSTGQIREAMFTPLSGKEKGLVGLWNFDNGNASDATKSGNHGRMIGRAKVMASPINVQFAVPGDMDIASTATKTAVAAAIEPVRASTSTNVVIVTSAPAQAAVVAGASERNVVAWCIAGALVVLAGLVAWLVLMLRRSGVGKPELLAAKSPALLGGAAAGASDKETKDRALAELTEFAKESLVQGLYSQRAALLEAQKQAQQELTTLELRLATMQLPERIRAYEDRITELEKELATRGEELREVTQATLLVFRRKLAEEKELESASSRRN